MTNQISKRHIVLKVACLVLSTTLLLICMFMVWTCRSENKKLHLELNESRSWANNLKTSMLTDDQLVILAKAQRSTASFVVSCTICNGSSEAAILTSFDKFMRTMTFANADRYSMWNVNYWYTILCLSNQHETPISVTSSQWNALKSKMIDAARYRKVKEEYFSDLSYETMLARYFSEKTDNGSYCMNDDLFTTLKKSNELRAFLGVCVQKYAALVTGEDGIPNLCVKGRLPAALEASYLSHYLE